MRFSILIAASVALLFGYTVSPALATLPSLGGSVTMRFVLSGTPPTWSWDAVGTTNSNTMLLTVQPVIDIAIKPSVIGPTTLSWGDNNNWTQPALDTSDFAMLTSGSGTYAHMLNNNTGTLDTLMSAGGYGPNNGDQAFVRVVVNNIQPSGGQPVSGSYSFDSNAVSNKFDVTIPTGAHVTQRGGFPTPTVENLTVQSGASLDTNGNTVRHTFTNHGSGAFTGTVEGDFINDALAANGNAAKVDGGLDVTGQLQNTGDLLIQGGYMKLLSATSNAGQLSFDHGTIQVDVSLSNSGTISLSNGGALNGSGPVTNNGVLQWSDGYLLNQSLVNNSNSFTITGSGQHYCDAALTNFGTITQSSTNSPGTAGTLTNAAGALYDITNDSGLQYSTFTNAGTFRKSGGSGTSTIGSSTTNSGTIAIYSGTLALPGSVTLNPSSNLQFQLSGVTPATNFGMISSSSTLALAGTLQVTVAPGFAPALSNSFDLFDLGDVTGTFSSLQLPPLAAGLKWDSSALYTAGVLSVAAGLPGDYDQNGVVDPRDYVLWRKYLGTIYTQSDYDTWRNHFGQTGGGGTSSTAAEIPEPTSATFFAISLFAIATLSPIRKPIQKLVRTRGNSR